MPVSKTDPIDSQTTAKSALTDYLDASVLASVFVETENDAELAIVVLAWPHLPPQLRAWIIAMIQQQRQAGQV